MPAGFTLNNNCLEFIVEDEEVAIKWAYNLGKSYLPKFGEYNEYFFKNINPKKDCNKVINNALTSGKYLQQDDVYFYVILIMNFYQGLLKTPFISYDLLNSQYMTLVKTAVNNFDIDPANIDQLISPIKIVTRDANSISDMIY